jgi:hypothetical protein
MLENLCTGWFSLKLTQGRCKGSYLRVLTSTSFKVCGCYSVCFFMFSVVLKLNLHNETCAAWANLRWRIRKKSHWNSDLPWCSYGYRKCTFVRFIQNTEVLSIVFTVACGVDYKTWRLNLISFKHVTLWCLFFGLHWTTHRSNIRIRLRKVTK